MNVIKCVCVIELTCTECTVPILVADAVVVVVGNAFDVGTAFERAAATTVNMFRPFVALPLECATHKRNYIYKCEHIIDF